MTLSGNNDILVQPEVRSYRAAILAFMGIFAAVLACLLIVWFSPHPANDARFATIFSHADFRFSEAQTPPKDGWIRAQLPFHDFYAAPATANQRGKILWAKLAFDANELPGGRIAFFADYTPERFIVLLNGKEIFRNYSDPDAQQFASFKPAFVTIPREALRPGENVMALRLETDTPWTLGLGNVAVGDDRLIRNKHDRAFALQYLGPQIINGIMAALTLAILLFWFRRREEKSFFWLAMVGIVWWLRNLHYSADDPFVGAVAMWELVSISIFMLTICFLCFTVTVLDVRNRVRWIRLSMVGGIALILFREGLLASGNSDFIAFALLAPFTFSLSVIFVIASIRHPSAENIVMLVAITIAILWSVHDMIFLGNIWQGAGFQLQPFASVAVYAAFAFSLGRRMMRSFDMTEVLNAQLEANIAQARHELSESEAARRELEVAHAVELERERLMREIHDGIGSNLVTALAVAKRQDREGPAVSVLKRSITDLKIAIDSLEPSNGDVSLVLAGFRQRAQADLNDAGIDLHWKVDALPPLTWLDAPNTLHVLRIFQEMVSNIIKHANASRVDVTCRNEKRGSRDGILVSFADDGTGLAGFAPTTAKGLANMNARAQALNALLDVSSQPGVQGTMASLWLPYDRTPGSSTTPRTEASRNPVRSVRAPDTKPVETRYPPDEKAASCYAQARLEASRRTAKALNNAVIQFRRVIELAPDFAPAYVGLAETWLAISDYGSLDEDMTYGRASATVRLALELEPDLASAHRALGLIHYWWERDIASAGACFRRALELEPDNAQTRLCYGGALSDNGEFDAARRELQMAQALDPDLIPVHSHLALLDWHFQVQTQPPAALMKLAIQTPDFVLNWHFLGLAQLCLGNGEEYVAALRQTTVLREEEVLFEELAHCEKWLAKGGSPMLWRELAFQAKSGSIGQPHAQLPMAALCASHGQDRAVLEDIFNIAQERGDRWGSSVFRHHIARLWKDDEWVLAQLANRTANHMESIEGN